jgi:uncharacterized membrane protein
MCMLGRGSRKDQKDAYLIDVGVTGLVVAVKICFVVVSIAVVIVVAAVGICFVIFASGTVVVSVVAHVLEVVSDTGLAYFPCAKGGFPCGEGFG